MSQRLGFFIWTIGIILMSTSQVVMKMKWDNHGPCLTPCRLGVSAQLSSSSSSSSSVLWAFHPFFLEGLIPTALLVDWKPLAGSGVGSITRRLVLTMCGWSSCSSLNALLSEYFYFIPIKIFCSDPFLRAGSRLWELQIRRITLPTLCDHIPAHGQYLADTTRCPNFVLIFIDSLVPLPCKLLLWTFI